MKKIIAGGFTVILLLIGAAILSFNRPPVDLEQLNSISVGSSKAEVKTVLGEPANAYDNDRKWAYSRLFCWPIVYLYFDDNDRFSRFEYDH